MKSLLYTCLFLLGAILGGHAQEQNPKDPKAKAILDKVSQKTKASNTIYMEFDYNLMNKQNGVDETQAGKVWMKGDMYVLQLMDIKRYCDGKTMWTYSEDDDEVTINNAVNEDEEESMSPTDLLTMYESGFNYQLLGTDTKNGKSVNVIKMYPEGGGKPYHTVKMFINKTTNELVSIQIFGKDGNTITYNLKSITYDTPMDNTMFTFDTSKAGDVIDMRD